MNRVVRKCVLVQRTTTQHFSSEEMQKVKIYQYLESHRILVCNPKGRRDVLEVSKKAVEGNEAGLCVKIKYSEKNVN